MNKKSINKSITEIANDTGLHKAEISMALNAKRLLNRNKLKKIVEANYPLEPFVFGEKYYDESISTPVENTQECKKGNEL